MRLARLCLTGEIYNRFVHLPKVVVKFEHLPKVTRVKLGLGSY